MSQDDLPPELTAIAAQIAAADPRTGAEYVAIASLTARFHRLVEVLVARGVIRPLDAKLLERLGGGAGRPRVALAQVRDKHAIVSPDIDCAAHLPLCQGRCCGFAVALTPDEVAGGTLKWNLEEPYMLSRETADGYCAHLQVGGACECYGDRPASCREFDCRDDRRVWLDYEQRIPAPMPEGMKRRF